ncbi:hypothetical protein [Bacillus solitudinis]|uniref:hypothetical protein n=1 Tax=Bacillus solitudinis TaxID=2014074 RepID=UPI000C248700|nr:hypothetical protein [Bacillus solitudinis]
MAYEKINFQNDSPPAANANNLNHLQKQYEEAVKYTDEAIKVKDEVVIKSYKFGIENGVIFLEEV